MLFILALHTVLTHVAAVALLAHTNETGLGDNETRAAIEANVLLTRHHELLYEGGRDGACRVVFG